MSRFAPVPLPTTHTAAESEVHTGLVHVEADNVADKELSKIPIFLPATEIKTGPKTGPLVEEIDDAQGASC